MPQTYRNAILETIKLSLADIEAGQPVADPYEYAFSSLYRGPLPLKSNTKRLVGAVLPGDESKTKGNTFSECLLDVMVDFSFTKNTGDEEPGVEAEKIIGLIQRRVLVDPTLNCLAIDTYESGSTVGLDSSEDKTVEGSVFFRVYYRHDLHDPRKYLGSDASAATATSLV